MTFVVASRVPSATVCQPRRMDELKETRRGKYQLQVLASAGLATCRRSGRRVYYRLAGDAAGLLAAHVQQFACERLAETERAARGYLGDVAALEPVSREELARRIQAGDILVLDVRQAAEYAAGHITGAVGIPHDELPARLSNCRAAPRSSPTTDGHHPAIVAA